MDGEDGRDVSNHMAQQIDENLKRAFGSAAPVPDRFLQLIEQLRAQEQGEADSDDVNGADGMQTLAGARR